MKYLIGLGLLTVLFSVSSCNKCHECHYDGPSGEVEIGEYCDDELKNLEDNGYTLDDTVYTVHCNEH